jgi:hypothetical protein
MANNLPEYTKPLANKKAHAGTTPAGKPKPTITDLKVGNV